MKNPCKILIYKGLRIVVVDYGIDISNLDLVKDLVEVIDFLYNTK